MTGITPERYDQIRAMLFRNADGSYVPQWGYAIKLVDAAAELFAALEQAQREAVEVWSCPDCAFTFSAEHTDVAGGGYSCPACAESTLEAQLTKIRDLFALRPDTSIRTTWHDGVEHWEVPAAEMREALGVKVEPS